MGAADAAERVQVGELGLNVPLTAAGVPGDLVTRIIGRAALQARGDDPPEPPDARPIASDRIGRAVLQARGDDSASPGDDLACSGRRFREGG